MPSAELGQEWKLVQGKISASPSLRPLTTPTDIGQKKLVPSCPEPFSGLIASWVLVFLNRQPTGGVQMVPDWPHVMMAFPAHLPSSAHQAAQLRGGVGPGSQGSGERAWGQIWVQSWLCSLSYLSEPQFLHV